MMKNYKFYCLTCHNKIIESINAFFFEDIELSRSAHIKEVGDQQDIVHVTKVIEKDNVDVTLQ